MFRSSLNSLLSSSSKPQNNKHHFSSFLRRVFDCTEASIGSGLHSREQQQLLDEKLFFWKNNATSLRRCFFGTDVRFHSVRVPVQRQLAAKRAMSRRRFTDKTTGAAAGSQKQSDGAETDYAASFEFQEQREETQAGLFQQTRDAPSEIKQDSLNRANELKRRVAKLSEGKGREKQASSAAAAGEQERKRAPPASNSSHYQHPLLRHISARAITDAVRDMREDRFAEFLSAVTERLRANSGGEVADTFAGQLCRAWLDAQTSFGFSYPSTESVCSPLLPTMLFFSAARDPELFLELQRRLRENRPRFEGSQGGAGGGGGGYTIRSLTTNSTLPGWIAAVSVAMDVALKEQAAAFGNASSVTEEEEEEEEEEGVDAAENSADQTPKEKKKLTLVDKIEQRLHPLLVDDRAFPVSTRAAAQRVLPIVLSTLSVTGLHRIQQNRVTVVSQQKKRNGSSSSSSSSGGKKKVIVKASTTNVSRLSFVTGTSLSASDFHLWSIFSQRICGVCSSASRTARRKQILQSAISQSSSSSSSSPVFQNHIVVPAYFSAFLLRVAERRAKTLAARRAASSSVAAHMSSIDGAIELAVGAFVSHLSLAARLGSSNEVNARRSSGQVNSEHYYAEQSSSGGSGDDGEEEDISRDVSSMNTAPYFALYVRFVTTLAECGCAAWVLESVLRDSLPCAHPATARLLVSLVAQAFPNQVRFFGYYDNVHHHHHHSVSNNKSSSGAAAAAAAGAPVSPLLASPPHSHWLLVDSSNSDLQQQQPVDTLAQPMPNSMWNALLEAAKLVSTPSPEQQQQEEEEEKEKEEDGEKQPQQQQQQGDEKEKKQMNSGDVGSVSLQGHLVVTRIRSACLGLVRNPEQLLVAAEKIKQYQLSNSNSNEATASTTYETCRSALLSSANDDATSWNDFVSVVLDSWIIHGRENPLLSAWPDSVIANKNGGGEDVVVVKNNNFGRRKAAASTLYRAIVDGLFVTPSPFLRGAERMKFEARYLESAEAAAVLLPFVMKRFFVRSCYGSSAEEEEEQQQQQRGNKQKEEDNLRLLLQQLAPLHLAAAGRVAEMTGDVQWLHEQYDLVINSPDSGFAGDIAAASSTALSPLLIKTTCAILAKKNYDGDDDDDVGGGGRITKRRRRRMAEQSAVDKLTALLRRLSSRGRFFLRFPNLFATDVNVRAILMPTTTTEAGAKKKERVKEENSRNQSRRQQKHHGRFDSRADSLFGTDSTLCQFRYACAEASRAFQVSSDDMLPTRDGAVSAAVLCRAVENDEKWARGEVERRMRKESALTKQRGWKRRSSENDNKITDAASSAAAWNAEEREEADVVLSAKQKRRSRWPFTEEFDTPSAVRLSAMDIRQRLVRGALRAEDQSDNASAERVKRRAITVGLNEAIEREIIDRNTIKKSPKVRR